MNRAPDGLISPATADIVAHGLVDVSVRGVGGFRQKGRHGHDLPRLTVSTLGNIFRDPGLLNRGAAVLGEAFNGGDALTGDVGNGSHAGAHRLSVEVYGAGAAQGHPA